MVNCRKFDYATFGEPLATPGPGRLGFIDKEKDFESKLGDFGVRKYEDNTGLFTSPDPLWESMYGWSVYAYSFNNPIHATDPSGLIPGQDWGAMETESGNPQHLNFANDMEGYLRGMSQLGNSLSQNKEKQKQQEYIRNRIMISINVNKMSDITNTSNSPQPYWNLDYNSILNPNPFMASDATNTNCVEVQGSYSFSVTLETALTMSDIVGIFNHTIGLISESSQLIGICEKALPWVSVGISTIEAAENPTAENLGGFCISTGIAVISIAAPEIGFGLAIGNLLYQYYSKPTNFYSPTPNLILPSDYNIPEELQRNQIYDQMKLFYHK